MPLFIKLPPNHIDQTVTWRGNKFCLPNMSINSLKSEKPPNLLTRLTFSEAQGNIHKPKMTGPITIRTPFFVTVFVFIAVFVYCVCVLCWARCWAWCWCLCTVLVFVWLNLCMWIRIRLKVLVRTPNLGGSEPHLRTPLRFKQHRILRCSLYRREGAQAPDNYIKWKHLVVVRERN